MKAFSRKLSMKVVKTISSDTLQKFCINHGYCDDCEWYEYEIMLCSANGEVTDDAIVKIANTIYCYTDTERIKAECDITSEELLNVIAWGLLNEVCTYSPKIEVSE